MQYPTLSRLLGAKKKRFSSVGAVGRTSQDLVIRRHGIDEKLKFWIMKWNCIWSCSTIVWRMKSFTKQSLWKKINSVFEILRISINLVFSILKICDLSELWGEDKLILISIMNIYIYTCTWNCKFVWYLMKRERRYSMINHWLL